MDPFDTTQLKEESLRWILAILGAVLVYTFAANIAVTIYQPDIEQLKSIANKLLADPDEAHPEPMEALLFRLGVIIIIPSILGFYMLLSKIQLVSPLATKRIYLFISLLIIASIIALVYYDFTALNPYGYGNGDHPQNGRDKVSDTNFDYYFGGLFLGGYLWVYALIIIPLFVCLFLIGFKKYHWDDNRYFKIFSSVAGYFIVGATIVAIVVMHTFYFPYANDNKYDFSAVYYSMTQVYAGSPMLADHFTNTYGLYPQFLNPLFQLTGMNIFKFSLVMSLLIGTSFLLNFYFLKKWVSNKTILFLGVTSILFFPYLNFNFTNDFDCIFSAYPIRYLIPCVLSCLATLYFLRRSVVIYWVTFFISALFILWNPEMGLVCYLSWVVVNIYYDFFTGEGKVAIRKILFHFISGICVPVIVFYAYKLVIYLLYGTMPDMQLLFDPIFIFGKIGFGLLPMSLVHPWNLMAIALIIGFTWPMVNWYKKEITPKSAMILLVSLIALGYFLYFQGRSQNSNFSLSSGYCFVLLTLLGDELWKSVKNNNLFFLNALFIVFLFFVSFSFVEIIFNTGKMKELVYQEEDKNGQAKAQETDESNTEFINKNSVKKEKIIILAQKKNQPLFFDGNKRVSAFNPGFVDLFFQSDADRLEKVLTDSSFDVFLQPSDHMFQYMARPAATLAATYEFKAVSKSIVLLTKRRNNILKQAFFDSTAQQVLYRKYNDDTGGIKLRINDAFGITTAPLSQQFSIEVLFYTAPQMFPNATIIADVKGSNGFAISNIYNTTKYVFSVNTKGFALQLPYYKWIYCVVNFVGDRLDVYINGAHAFSGSPSTSMQTPVGKISIGGIGSISDFNYYVGPISEVAVANKVLDTSQIRKTWDEIEQVIRE